MFNFSFENLYFFRQLGLRNRNWFRLGWLDKALYNCALKLAKIKGEIKNLNLMVKLAKIILRLREKPKTVIFKFGLIKALALKKLYAYKGVFDWCLSLKNWLNEPSYIFWLGLKEIYG
jgi:hypothetical protein